MTRTARQGCTWMTNDSELPRKSVCVCVCWAMAQWVWKEPDHPIWLVVNGCHEFGIFPEILGCCPHPNWLIFFRGVAKNPPAMLDPLWGDPPEPDPYFKRRRWRSPCYLGGWWITGCSMLLGLIQTWPCQHVMFGAKKLGCKHRTSKVYVFCHTLQDMGGPKTGDLQILHFTRIFHEISHLFVGTPIDGKPWRSGKIPCQSCWIHQWQRSQLSGWWAAASWKYTDKW